LKHESEVSKHRSGFILALLAYFMWGFFPLFWPLLKPTPALQILAHRVLWGFACAVLVLLAKRDAQWMRQATRKQLLWLSLASVLVSINWGLYIWAVNVGRVVETSLGYFINPLVTVLLGVFILGERLRKLQSLFLGCVAISVTVMAVGTGQFPWIALLLACSFASYGFVKKMAQVEAIRSFSFESGFMTIPALIFLLVQQQNQVGAFGTSVSLSLLMVISGILTAVPLVLFGAAANVLPLKTMGPLQYVAPSLQFLCGVVVFHEPMSGARWVGFILLFISLAAFVVEGILNSRARTIN
jgi:chloramphenicol-sensitive protein RarD